MTYPPFASPQQPDPGDDRGGPTPGGFPVPGPQGLPPQQGAPDAGYGAYPGAPGSADYGQPVAPPRVPQEPVPADPSPDAAPVSYAAAGVDVAAGERAVELMRASVARAQRPEVVDGFGGFAGLFDLSAAKEYQKPLLATSTDGVGTKVAIARALDRHETIGRDLVAMIVDDIVVVGAEPLFLTDYIACGRVDPERIAAIVSGIADGCAEAGVALIGGETAEHPGLMEPDEYDLAGAGTGIVDADYRFGPHWVQPGDVLVGLSSSGLHSNGYSLARAVLFRDDPAALAEFVPELGRTIGEELLEPTRIYAPLCLSLARSWIGVHAMAHVTGGGLAANIARVIPTHMTAVVDRGTWQPPAVFDLISSRGVVPREEMETAFNMGIGMVLVADPVALTGIFQQAGEAGVGAFVIGQVRDRQPDDTADSPAKGGAGGTVMLVGDYRSG